MQMIGAPLRGMGPVGSALCTTSPHRPSKLATFSAVTKCRVEKLMIRPPPPTHLARLEGKRATMVVTRLAPGLVLITVRGYNDGELLEQLHRIVDAEIAVSGGGATFIDSRLQTGASPEARDASARWAKNMGATLRSSNLLFSSKVLEVIVAAANFMIGGGKTKAYSDVRKFEMAIEREIPGFTILPRIDI